MSQTKAQLLAPVGIFTASGINVSGTLTATSYSGSGANLTGVGVGTTASVNTSGIITAVSFYGDGSNLSGVGFGTTSSAVTTGIITASKFSGSGIGLTNIGGPIAGLVYNPSIGATNINVGTNIEITFSKPIQAGVGTITLRTGSASGTIVESFDVASSNRLTISTAKLTIDPSGTLGAGTTHYVVIPSGALKDTYAGISSNVGISSYYFLTRAEESNFQLWMWGLNSGGPLGQNDTTQYSSPIQVPGTQWKQINNCYQATYGVKSDGTLWSWGGNGNGQLGQNNLTQYSSPRQVPGTQWSSVVASYLSATALKSDGTLWAWGYNYNGQLGQGDLVEYSSPRQIPGTQWTIISNQGYTGYSQLAKKSDGTLWTWGSNGNGQLGQNNTTQYLSPRQIPGTQWSDYLFVCGVHMIATKTDGTLWTWGGNGNGQLGQGNTTLYSSPTQIPGTQWSTDAGSVSGSYGSFALKTNGTLWGWGVNSYGQLGQGNTTSYSSPTQIPGTNWSKGNLMHTNAMALKTDGTLWSWGRATYGGIGDDQTATDRLSPVQIPGTQWYSLAGGVYQHIATKTTTS